MKYEMVQYESDPFDLMCSDCHVNDIEYWIETTEEELREIHAYILIEDNSIPDNQKDAMAEEFGWTPAPKAFDEWLKQEIEQGCIRELSKCG